MNDFMLCCYFMLFYVKLTDIPSNVTQLQGNLIFVNIITSLNENTDYLQNYVLTNRKCEMDVSA